VTAHIRQAPLPYLRFVLNDSSDRSNVPRTMEKLKAVLKPGKKQPKTAYNPKRNRPERTSSNPTLPNPRPHPETKHSGPSSEDSPPGSFPDGVEVLHDCPDATVDI